MNNRNTLRHYRPVQVLRLYLLLLVGLGAQPGVAGPGEPIVASVESVGITVRDLDSAVEFYHRVLSFQETKRYEVQGEDYEHLYGVFGLRLQVAEMRLGEEKIELMQFLAPQGRLIPVDSKSNDEWFQHIAIITKDMDRAYRHLRNNNVAHASSGPQLLPGWNPNAGGISAFYFRDPDGNHLEILQFPDDKGDAKWHRPGEALFLGIDHTAIVVADTTNSTEFYRGLLGMRVAGVSENYGPEQERLNNVFGARLRITAFRASKGIGIELLEYLAPQGGRAMPVDSTATDLWHWQINVTTSDDSLGWRQVLDAKTTLVSAGPISLRDTAAGYHDALMVRDPDGHALLLQR